MTPEEAERVRIIDAIRDEELERIEDFISNAKPGAWRYRPATGEMHHGVERFGGAPVASLRFVTEARAFVPRLMRGIRALERAWRNARAEAKSWRLECLRERERHHLTTERRAGADGGEELMERARAIVAKKS